MDKTALLMRAVLALAVVVATGCQSMDKALKAADSTLGSGTVQEAVKIAKSDDRRGALESLKEDPRQLLHDIQMVKGDFERLVAFLRGNVSKKWGEKEVKIPSKKQYVKYTQNYKSRAIVDFDTGTITVETLDDKDPQGSLKNAIVTTLLTPDDPRSVDLFSDQQVKLSSDRTPYLYDLVVDQRNQPIGSPEAAEAFADYLIEHQMDTRQVQVEDQEKKALFVQFDMVGNFEDKQAEKYQPMVAKYAEEYQTSQSLIFAIIKTESNFNPYAVSSAPAYGLMQLVPTSGGREGYRKAKGEDAIPSKESLFQPETNIELGTAYLNVLAYNQLSDITDPTSREYCVISAYNTGPGNVLKTFSKDQDAAVDTINRMATPDVYTKLISDLPYEETRQYLPKVVQHRKAYVRP